MSLLVVTTYAILGGLIVFLLAALSVSRKDRCIEVKDTMLAPEELERHAVEVARNHPVGKTARSLQWLVRRMNENFIFISEVYRELNADVKVMFPTAPAAEWLLDNFYIIEEQFKLIRRNLSKGRYSRLPVLKKGYLRGYPRVYAIALELIAHTDGRIDEKTLIGFINAYQSQSLLSMGELWAVDLMLRVALVENIRNICEGINKSQQEWHRAEKLADFIAGKELDDHETALTVKEQLARLDAVSPSFVEHLLQKLRKHGKGIPVVTYLLDIKLHEKNSSTEEVTGLEHQLQAARQVSIGNTITGLRLVSDIDWSDIFESLSQVELILRQDPCGIYTKMDFESRDNYRHEVEKLARAYNTSEINIARKAVDCASDAFNRSPERSESAKVQAPHGHVGYYLIGKGRNLLADKLGVQQNSRRKFANLFKKYPAALYISMIFLVTAFLTSYFAYYASTRCVAHILFYSILTAVIVLIPCSELSITVINTVLSHVFRPAMMPKLELKDGIPEDFSTMVIIPTLLPNEKRVAELLEQLEVFYLSNRENNLFYALVGDFKDSAGPEAPGDDKIISAALQGIIGLNKKYSSNSRDIFHYMHRRREFNTSQGKWMGRERKRGAIVEFNRLLRGCSDTGYTTVSSDLSAYPRIKYVITLDADTCLPMGSAKKLIGTMAHPLNSAVVDENTGIVTDGYGLLQPRISVSISCANKSLFTRIFAGQGGIDPYTTAVSDIYQDIFSEGIFTGKGIYDVDIFRLVLETRIPDNTVLSHDLIEGCHLRAGLVSDIELVDGYPSRYNSFAMRLHRWVRGDWQLLPWLCSKVRDRSGQKSENRLSLISRWKILDNMRRSLINPFLFVLTVSGLGILPGSFIVWVGFAVLVNSSPLLTFIMNALLSGSIKVVRTKRNSTVITGIKASVYQSLLLFAFIPYQAWLMSDAVLRTIARVFFTRRNLLEWITAADMENSLKSDMISFWRRMWVCAPAALLAIAAPLFLFTNALILAVPVAVSWLAAPFAAFLTSKPYARKEERLSQADSDKLRRIARKTWRYFEDFALKEDNYLPPDNYQEDPPRGAAHRTSPTNIGLLLISVMSACDLGYIGITEMVGRLNNIITTIEKMEKWKGHLYNWYNTITLDTMKPLYVSTVDSGNLIGYLMALREGLKEYLRKPLLNVNMVLGLRDTLRLLNEDVEKTGETIDSSALDELVSEDKPDLYKWNSILTTYRELAIRPGIPERLGKSSWGTAFISAVAAYKRELDEMFPAVANRDIFIKVSEILSGLPQKPDSNASLKELSQIHEKIILLAEGQLAGAEDDKTDRSRFYKVLEYSKQAKIIIDGYIVLYENLIGRIEALINATEFTPLFDPKRQLFSIGFNVDDGHLSKSYYDLLASEARQASYIAIARGEVDRKHWFRLGRKLTSVDGFKGLISWTGTMFEYLMPYLIMRNFENTLFDETYSFVARTQKKYARQRKIPWGISESGYHAFDINLNYQYKAFGVPELGLKRGLGNDMVAAPYAAILAIGIDPVGVVRNIEEFERFGMDGAYGLYEAVDFTPSRLERNSDSRVVKSYMAHHQGMSMAALNNYLNGNIMQTRFHADPVIKSAELLLQEKSPERGLLSKEYRDESESVFTAKRSEQVSGDAVRTYGIPDAVIPAAHILSNGSYSVMVTDGGSGYSKNGDVAVTRWSRDCKCSCGGMYIYILNVNSNESWSAAYEPVKSLPEKYRVIFSPDKAEFSRRDGSIETYTEVTVSPEDNAEVRRVSLTNHSTHTRIVEATSYFEAVIAPPADDAAHPAFSKLFVRTEFIKEFGCLLASRRLRSERQKPVWLVHTLAVDGETIGDIQYETDRMKFTGRNSSLANPAAMEPDQPLTNSEGSVLDPVMCLRRRLRIEPGQTVRISFAAAVAETRKNALELAEKYNDFKTSERVFELSWTRSQVESRYLGLNSEEVELFLELVPLLLLVNPLRTAQAGEIIRNTKSQQDLWPFGISGDLPIILVVIRNRDDMDIAYWALKGHEYWRMKGLPVDLVIFIENEGGYAQPTQEIVRDAVASSHAREMLDKKGGVFIRNTSIMDKEQITLFYTAARVVVKDGIGALKEQIRQIRRSIPKEIPVHGLNRGGKVEAPVAGSHDIVDKLRFFNGLGGFSSNGREYVIRLEKGQHTPAPWTNVISNKRFGFLVSETGGGYTWSENSRENKLTPWSNDPVTDTPGEVFYIKDANDGSFWSLTPLPVREDETYIVRHGHGYSVFEHVSHGIEQSLTLFAAVDDPVKICLISLKEMTGVKRDLSLTYYIRPVLGVDDYSTAPFITTELNGESGMLVIQNRYSDEFRGRIAFIDTSEAKHTCTGDMLEFLGPCGSLFEPAALFSERLSGRTGAGMDPCAAIQVKVVLEADGEKQLVFLLGETASITDAVLTAVKYKNPCDAAGELEKVKNFWNDKLEALQVDTPDESMNIMLNGWLLYQTVSCRLWARSAFYQSGGAYGFRDQLQDCMAVVDIWPELTRKQILLHASRQFTEGDVQHWWHSETGKGIRTKYSDDLLWLSYVTTEYIEHTADIDILDAEVPFIKADRLNENEDERYDIPQSSGETASIYDHCCRAIELSLRFGVHGLPLMGSGDWNDGMNTVGNKGRGESVWLGWFLYTVIKRFIPLCISRNDKKRAEKYEAAAGMIMEHIENKAWDGSWYIRAYFDDGSPLGSARNSECRIDSIAQSWSVISGAAKQHRMEEAMDAVEKYLVDREEGIVKLLTPPFDKGLLNPGYIKGYVPGVRENGGQYTHAAAWVVFAFARLGMGDRAWELFHLVNPVNHARTPIEYARYKVEPYVIAADVYAVTPHIGRGGWTWYTGAAGWFYKTGIEHMLGFQKRGGSIAFNPCIPAGWDRFTIRYRFGSGIYNIEFRNPDRVNKGVISVKTDGILCSDCTVTLSDDGREHNVEVLMG